MKLVFAHDRLDPAVRSDEVKISLDQLGQVDDAGCSSISLHDTLDYVVDRYAVLNTVVSKLRYGGELAITGIDLHEIATALHGGQITVVETQTALHGGKQSTDALFNIRNYLLTLKLEVVKQKIDGYSYEIIVRRPNVTNI